MLGILSYSPLLAVCFLTLTAQVAITQPLGSVAGRVIDGSTGQPVASARIQIGTDKQAISGADGTFRLERVTLGGHEVIVRRLGYLPHRSTVRVSDGAFMPIEVAMTPMPAELPGVTVEAAVGYLGGFWDRQKHGMGHFLTRADLDRRKPNKLVDMFRGVNGAKIVLTDHGYAVASQRGARGFSTTSECVAAVFLDGVPFQMSSAGLNDIDPSDVEAIEYYSSAARVPSQFNSAVGVTRPGSGLIGGHPKCGVVAIWSRGRP